MKYFYFLLIPLLFINASCSRVSVDTVYDPSVSFKGLKTYSWEHLDAPDDRLESYPEIKKMVHEAVDMVLRLKGFELRESGPTDFKVATYAGVKQAMRLTRSGRVHDNTWLGPAGRYDYSKAGKVTLFIDIFDGKTGELIWRGIGVGFMHNYSIGDKMRKGVNESVAYILRSFPPS